MALRKWPSVAVIVLAAVIGASVTACLPWSATDALPGSKTDAADGLSIDRNVRVLATTDFGSETLLDETLPLEPGMSALDALQLVADVGTLYGGGFVDSINGVGPDRIAGQSANAGWFYFVNGIMANGAAGGYVLRPGDVEHWDHHDWTFRQLVSAGIGCFPSAFVHGYGGTIYPTVVAYGDSYAAEADDLAAVLEGAGALGVQRLPIAQLLPEHRESSNLVIVAGSTAGPVVELNQHWDRLGLFAQFVDSGLQTYAGSGAEAGKYFDGVGLLQAMQSPWNPSGVGVCENVVLLVSGNDADGVRAAAGALAEGHEAMTHWCAAVVLGGEAHRIPSAGD